MGYGQGSFYGGASSQQMLGQGGGGNTMHLPHDRIGSAQGHRGIVGTGQHQSSTATGTGSATGGPHLLPNHLAAHLNNPGMPGGGTSPNTAPEMLLSHYQSKNANALPSHAFSPQSHQSIPQQSSHHHQQSQSGQQSQTGRLLLLPSGQAPPPNSDEAKIYILIAELLDPLTRETALLELSKKREMYEDLALVLWGGFGIMSSLLLEIVYVYPALSPPSLSAHASNRVCNALALLQCVASHAETRSLFLNAHIPLFLYPFLNTTSKTRPFEYLRLTSLGVIGALVKQNDNSDVINFLLSTEIIPLCLRIMETGSELSKTVAIFIVQKILLDDLGLSYICQTYERFYAVGTVLSNMVNALVDSQAVRLLKHVVRCYLRLSDNPRAREALRACLPDALRDATFTALLKGDMVTKRCLTQLLSNLSERTD